MKKLLISLIALISLATVAVQAQSVAIADLIVGRTNAVYTNLPPGLNVRMVRLYSATTNQVRFFDAPAITAGGALVFTNNSYSNILSGGLFTNSVIFTNSVGRVNTNKSWGQSNYWALVVAATNLPPVIGSVTLAAGVPYDMPVNWNIAQGLWALSTTSATVTVEYNQR